MHWTLLELPAAEVVPARPPSPMCSRSHSPLFGSRRASALWLSAAIATPCRANGPSGVLATPRTIWLFVSQESTPQPPTNSEKNPCQSLLAGSYAAVPPQDEVAPPASGEWKALPAGVGWKSNRSQRSPVSTMCTHTLGRSPFHGSSLVNTVTSASYTLHLKLPCARE